MTIPISGDLRPSDPLSRKRPAAGAATGNASRADTGTGSATDRAAILSSSPEAVKGYVQILKGLNPVDLHRVEELRERIRSGEYHADPEEMAGPLADILRRGRSGNRGA